MCVVGVCVCVCVVGVCVCVVGGVCVVGVCVCGRVCVCVVGVCVCVVGGVCGRVCGWSAHIFTRKCYSIGRVKVSSKQVVLYC